jgi:hypothetical protein
MPSISSTNAVFLLSVVPLYTVPQVIQGFGPDEILTTEPLEAAELQMGIDGILSAGYVHVPVRQVITLSADSPSNAIFDNWFFSQTQINDLYFATGTITLTSIGTKYALTQGVLHTYPSVTDVSKRLMPRKYGIAWQSIVAAPIIGAA